MSPAPETPETPEAEPLSGMPDGEQDADLPLGIPSEEDDEALDRALPGFPEGDIDTAG